MKKLPSKIPPEQIKSAQSWMLSDVAEGAKTIRTRRQKVSQELLARRSPDDRSLPKRPPDRNAVIKAGRGRQTAAAAAVADSDSVPSNPASNGSEVSSPEQTQAHDRATNSPTSNEPETNEALAPEKDHPTGSSDAQPVEQREDAGFAEGFKKGETEGYVQGEQKGYSAGHEAGMLAGRQEAEQAYAEEVANQKQTIAGLVAALSNPQQLEPGIEEALTSLVSNLAQVVLMGELKSHPEHVATLVRVALDALPHSNDAPRVLVHPSDVEAIENLGLPELEIIPDQTMARGGCKISAGQSEVEQPLSRRIRDALIASFAGDPIEELPGEADLQQLDSALDP